MSGAKATLAGVDLLALNEVGWRLTRGVEPFQRTFQLRRSDAQKAMETYKGQREQGIELKIASPGRPELVVQGLHILSFAPGNHRDRVSVLVSDFRWTFNRRHIKRRYNIRRRSGDLRLARDAEGSEFSLQRLDPVNDVKYAKWSLHDETQLWLPFEILVDIVTQVVGGVENWRLYSKGLELPIQDLEFDDDGPGALRRLQALFPGINYYVARDGKLIVDNDHGAGDLLELKAAAPPVRGGQTLVERVELGNTRPKKIHVFFTCEDELRFDYDAQGTRDGDARFMDNVLQLPDAKLTFSTGPFAGKTFYHGSWVTIDDHLLTAWHASKAPTLLNIPLPQLTIDVLNRTYISQRWFQMYRETQVEPDSLWDRRIAQLMNHYRRTFRFNLRWLDLIRSFKAERVALLDAESGVRAPADVFCDYTVRPRFRQVARNEAERKNLFVERLGKVSAGSPTSWDGALLKDAKVAPARVEVLDQDLGVFHVNFQLDPNGEETAIIPGRVESIFSSTSFPLDSPAARALLWDMAKLKPSFKLSTVFTFAAGAVRPPISAKAGKGDIDTAYAHRVERDLLSSVVSQAALPVEVLRNLTSGSEGPEWSVHVGPGIETARFAWLDEHKDQIEQVYLHSSGDRPPDTLINRESVNAVADVVAAQIYGSLADHYEGMHVSSLDVEREPRGRITRVTHSLLPTGQAFTSLELLPKIDPIDIFAMLPDSYRNILLRIVQR